MVAMNRRKFIKSVGASAFAAAFLAEAADRPEQQETRKMKKAVQLGMLPQELPDEEKFRLARRCGFEGIEAYPMEELDAAKRLGDAAREAGVPIHSICYGGWKNPLSDPRPEIAKQGLRELENALETARATGADTVLLVPAVVTETIGYGEAWERSHARITEILPKAEELGIVIAVENVWNKFLLSPLEFARYVDEFQSPWLQAYFDVGNVILFGFSQDWIRTLGKRIRKIHLKDFKRQGYEWVNLGDGDVNWAEVRRALTEIGYEGYLTPELSAGDEGYLTDVSHRMDKLLVGT